jgi:uncharacterized protein (DUF1778 family)
MQSRKTTLPPSRAVLILLPLSLIELLDTAADVLNMSRSDVVRRSLMRDAHTLLREEIARMNQRPQAWSNS